MIFSVKQYFYTRNCTYLLTMQEIKKLFLNESDRFYSIRSA